MWNSWIFYQYNLNCCVNSYLFLILKLTSNRQLVQYCSAITAVRCGSEENRGDHDLPRRSSLTLFFYFFFCKLFLYKNRASMFTRCTPDTHISLWNVHGFRYNCTGVGENGHLVETTQSKRLKTKSRREGQQRFDDKNIGKFAYLFNYAKAECFSSILLICLLVKYLWKFEKHWQKLINLQYLFNLTLMFYFKN